MPSGLAASVSVSPALQIRDEDALLVAAELVRLQQKAARSKCEQTKGTLMKTFTFEKIL